MILGWTLDVPQEKFLVFLYSLSHKTIKHSRNGRKNTACMVAEDEDYVFCVSMATDRVHLPVTRCTCVLCYLRNTEIMTFSYLSVLKWVWIHLLSTYSQSSCKNIVKKHILPINYAYIFFLKNQYQEPSISVKKRQ